ncbi:FKBP-type peptidyl-prolyl cis-trans isomerase [Microbacterium marinilacus]|uniref:FKBP-type peptidyl-prolyl cis-trans isomerase n=1 Tax=Microbacterium marinilacus TaxID=415209 RepID=UPI001C8EBA17|nr:FKBP-type peptidyl-prolyl cis-trans isomerase [Microbacterium marinilacus]MBY0690093.1 FKBP-type peptidyl-prolyl cis-trans isomerase [Microbacterium marinilacus]
MRLRPAVVLSALAVTALALAGCSGDETPESTPSASGEATDLCSLALPSGAAAEAVTVEGEAGETPTIALDGELDITTPERVVVSEGDGEQLELGQNVDYALTVFDATTGEQLESVGYDDPILPEPLSTDSGAGQLFGCATVGSRIVATVPGSDSAAATVYVIDLLGNDTPTAARGDAEEPVDGQPTVELAESGEPTITLPDADAPTETEVTTLKTGDGDVVESGDFVLVQYAGVKWSDGSVFDSSWAAGAAAPMSTTGVVAGFQKALEGQTVGSQVLVTMPPADGYGEGEINDQDLTGETLTFVVDILAVQHVEATE